MGDLTAARIGQRFSDLVRENVARSDGHVVKQIGDEFMLVFPNPAAAMASGRGIQAAAAAEPQFPALRLGAHAGPVLYREGDYLGANVNLAARVTSAAARNQFLVTEQVQRQADGQEGELASLGTRSLRGVRQPVKLFEVRSELQRASRPVDPVCGMELDETSAAASLAGQGRRLPFCSEGCLRLFLQSAGTQGAG